jgi:hypothetical protein
MRSEAQVACASLTFASVYRRASASTMASSAHTYSLGRAIWMIDSQRRASFVSARVTRLAHTCCPKHSQQLLANCCYMSIAAHGHARVCPFTCITAGKASTWSTATRGRYKRLSQERRQPATITVYGYLLKCSSTDKCTNRRVCPHAHLPCEAFIFQPVKCVHYVLSRHVHEKMSCLPSYLK